MRQLGKLPQREQAERFVAHLLTQGVSAKVDPAGEQWAIWVQDEDAVAAAKSELEAFQREPNHARYQGVEQKAQRLVQEQVRRRESAAKNIVEMKGRWRTGTGVGQPAPWTVGLILISIAASLLTNFAQPSDQFGLQLFSALSFVDWAEFAQTRDPLANLKQGQVWRAVTPMFLHGNMLHLAFNMMWLYQLGRLIEWKLGRWRLLQFVVLFSAITSISNAVAPTEPEWLARILGSGPGIGMSGVVYGLFGFIWMQSKYNPSFGVRLEPFTVILMVGWLVYCFLPFSSMRVANIAHLSGLLAGVVVGRLPLFGAG